MSKPASIRGSVRALCIVPVIAVIAIAFLTLAPAQRRQGAATIAPSAHARVQANYASLPLAFEANQGQTDSQVKYMARGDGYVLFLTAHDAVFSLQSQPAGAISTSSRSALSAKNPRKTQPSTAVVRMELAGGNSQAKVSASNQLPGKSNYFVGNDPSKWRTEVPHYARVSYQDVYPGVNLAFHGAQRQTEFDFVVAPNASPAPIGFHFTGAEGIKTDDSGNLVISSAAGNVLLRKPVAYQEQNGARQVVGAQFVLTANNQVRFELGNYDRNRELVIDPSVSYAYSTFLGGSGADEGQGISFDSTGAAYVTGQTASANFPGASGFLGVADVFVTKIAPDGSSLDYSTYIGGTGTQGDSGNAIAVNPTSGVAYVTGGATSSDFPTTTGVFQKNLNGTTGNAFVCELSAGGTITYCTFLGGTGTDTAFGIALASDSSGDVYVVGKTSSSDFPTQNPLQASLGAGNIGGGFVTKLNSSGTAPLLFSTYLGGSSVGDVAGAVAVDSANNVYVAGQTFSSTFPFTAGAYQTTCGSCSNGMSNAFVTVINPTGSAYVYSTFLGGSGSDSGNGIAADAAGDAYVVGTTNSTAFPTTTGVLQTGYGGGTDAFVTKLNPAGSALVYSTYLGGSGFDAGASIALDGSDNAYVTGQTNSPSPSFPVVAATQPARGGANDAFVSEINSAGSALLFSTYLGGSGDEDDGGNYGAIAVDSLGDNIYVTGNTTSTNFPTDVPYQGVYGGSTEAFVVKYTTGANFNLAASALSPASVAQGSSATSTVTVTAVNGFTGNVAFSCTVTGPTGATSPPTCGFVPTQVSGSGSPTLTVSTAATTTAGIYAITVIGTGPSTTQSTPLSLTVTAVPPTFSLSATALSPASVTPGGAATSMVTVTPAGGFSGTVTITCAITGPSGAIHLPTCGSASATPAAPGTLTVSTTAAIAFLRQRANTQLFYAMFLPVGGMALLGFGSAGSRRRKLLGLLLLGLLLSGLLLMPACGGGSSGGGGGGGTPGTTAGNYTITVTGTATGASQTGASPSLTLTVN